MLEADEGTGVVKLDGSDSVFASLVGEGAIGVSPAKDQPGALDMIGNHSRSRMLSRQHIIGEE